MAATMQHCGSATTTSSPSLKPATNTSPNPQLKRLVYSKYRELLGSYNDQANAYIETLPSYMVQKDNGFNLETQSGNTNNNLNGAITTIHLTSSSSPSPAAPSSLAANEMYGSGQRMPPQSTYEAPACVQNAMNRDKKPFTYTPGGIDLSQIKSERMAKRLARNACAEGAAGKSQQNRPVVTPISPGSPGCAAATIGAAAMGMPFQVLPPSPHLNMAAGKNINGGCAPAPPPPPPPSSSNFLNTGSQMNGNNGMNGVRGSSPNSPNMQQQRKIPPAPPSQRFEPPPLGFRPEIKIPPNPMAGLRKVPPPVEKNTFWKDEYKKNKVADEAPSHRVEATNMPMNNSHNVNGSSFYAVDNDSVNGSSSTTPQTNASNGTDQLTTNGETNFKTDNSDYIDGFKKTMPTTTTNKMQANQTNNLTNTQEPEAIKTPPTSASSPPSQESPQKSPQATSPDTQSIASINRPTPSTSPQQQALIKANTSSPSPQPSTAQQQVERESATPPAAVAGPPKPASSPPQAAIHLQTEAQQQKQQSPKPEFRSVAAASPQPAAVNVFNRQTDSPRSVDNATPPRVTDSPFRLAQQQQQRPPVAISPLAAQQQMAPMAGATISPNNQAQTVPWRTQRSQTPQQQAPPSAQSHPQPFYGSMPQQQQQQQQQRTPDFSTQTSAYQGPKPTNVGSLYIAPLAAPPEPQAQHIVMQQMQQQQPQRDSPMRQMGSQPTNQQLRWMSSQPKQTEQPAWARPEENGNVVPSSLNRLKSPPPQQQQQQTTFPGQGYQQMYQPQPQPFQAPGNGFMTNPSMPQNFGALHNAPAGLRLQINTNLVQNTNNTINQSGPREHIIPIQLEQTPTYAPAQPTFNAPSSFSAGTASPGYVMRTPNQFVDQGYNNYGTHQSTPQRVMSPPQQQQQLNAPRMVQQQQQQSSIGNNRTHIVPIAVENNEGIRGPISKTPIVIQNGNYNLVVHDCPLEAEIRFRKYRLSDLRTPPVQSKSFRILQKITDTIDDGNNDDSGMIQQRNDNYMDAEPQLQRPTFARQMSAQLARNSPTVEQMRRMKIGQEQEYVPPSEQQVPEPKKYTGSAIPSRSFKILQAMTQPENAGEQDNVQEYNDDANDETKSEGHNDSCTSSSVEPTSSASSMSSLSSTDSVRSGPSRPSPQPMAFPPYPYPYAYPWYPPPPHAPCALPSSSSGDSVTNPTTWPYPYAVPASPVNGETANAAASWPYAPPYGMPPPPNTANGENGQQPTPFPPYPYYYPYYPIPPFPTHSQSSEFDPQNVYAPYLPPPPPYHVYPYPVAPSYSQTSSSSRASSVLPDIIITPSTDDVPSQVVLKHHIKVDKDKLAKRSKSVDIEDVSSIKSNSSLTEGSVVDILSQHLQNMAKRAENNSSSSQSTKSSEKTVAEKPKTVHIAAVKHAVEHDSDSESSVDSDATTKQYDNQTAKEGSVPLQSIKSVTNVQIYNALKQQPEDEEDESEEEEVEEEDDDTTADGESDVFDEEAEEEEEFVYEHHEEHDSGSEDYIVDDGLSVIYEEESDFDKSSENNKPLRNAQALEDLNKCIEEDDDHDDDENENENHDGSDAEQEDEDNCDTNSVTVRLPLKFSFTKSANSEPVAATVEVGKSLVEERRKSIPQPNCFKIATIESDSEADDSDSCGVSVTISLSQSSRSGSVDSKESERKTTAEKYPLEDMPVPENLEAKLNASQEDVSFSFSLNKRNKFVGQTLKGDLTNNITQVEEESPKEAERTPERKQSAEELDFFATLMATKMQAQKIKEQSASYWGKGKEQKQESAEVQAEDKETQKKIDEEELKARTSFWAKYSAIKPAEVKADKSEETCSSYDKSDSSNANETQSSWDNNSSNNDSQITNDGEGDDDEIEDIWADREEIPVIRKETQTSYWDTFAKSNTDYQAVDNQLKDNNECLESDEIEDIWADQNDDDYIPVRKPQTTCVELESPVEVQLHEEEVVDIWAERDECDDVSAVKVRSKKLDSLETARDSFWSTVAQANKCSGDTQNDDDTEFWSEQKMSKPQMKQEIITEICYSPTVLRHRIEELSKSLKPTVHVVEEEKEEEKELEPELKTQDEEVEVTEDEEEVDFWAKIDESREAKASEASSAVVEPSTPEFDPLKYPEEPREVDTDEEIDFWAEIDANRLPDDTDITFHRAASFWASRDLRNSIDETPYKPVQTKAFPAKLPDDPIADETGLWATLEAHKGEEAVLVDPLVEEEKELAQEFDEMSQQPDLYEEEEEEYVAPAPEEPVAQAEVWQATPPSTQTEVWQTTPPAAQTEVWQTTPPAAQTEVWHSIPSTQTEFWQATPPAVQTEIWQTTPTAAQTEIWQPTPAVMGKYEAWRATPTMEMADVWSAPTTTQYQSTVAQSTQPEFNTEAEVNPNSAIEKELNAPEKDELEVKRNNYRKAMAFFTTSIDEHKEESPALSEKKAIQEINNNCHSFAAEEQQKLSPLEQEQQQQINVPPITEEFKKPPKKENKPKGKSKSPKGKSKEIKCNTPSTETPEVYVEPSLEMKRLPNGLPDLGVNKFNEERKISVRDRISVFESGATEIPEANGNTQQSLSVDGAATRRSSLSRHSSSQRSESEVEEDDSGVTDMNKLSETETESGSFPELRKMSSYQRAATHSRLFKLLQDDTEGLEDSNGDKPVDEFQLRPSRRKVVHNVSITRKQNPQALAEVETMSQRRERLSLPLRKNTSIDADNPSTPNSPASPIMDHSANQCVVSDKLVSELVQSLLLKSDSTHLRKLPMEKLQAAAKRVLEEELDSLDNTSVDSTPSMTPNELKKDRSYADYYNTWSDANGSGDDVVPSKSFKALQDPRRSPWTVRCPRVLSSKTINRDLARVTESPEIHMRSSMSPECFRQSRENSVSRWRKA
uniref:Uncharacterized protein n=1 Tax=Stomoxys calcitrans TaxID=35570 RepID=A0A1I8Q5P7_STOCA